MTLRGRLLLAQLPLVVALAVTAVAASMVTRSLGRSSRALMDANYRSVLAAQHMKEALAPMDRGRFEEELRFEERNITEEGELAAVRRLRGAWDAYQRSPEPGSFTEVERAAEAIVEMNQEAMIRRSDRAQRTAGRFDILVLAGAAAACLLGVLAATALTTRVLRPLTVLGHVARRIGAGELDARARLGGQDEIAALARELDSMAEHLERYRRSSLGELLEAQRAAQAAMDSLPDPVLVIELDGRFVQVNRSAEDVLGVSVETAGRDTVAAVEPETRAVIERLREHVLAGKGSYAPRGLEEAFRLAASGGERHFLPRASPVYAVEGAIAGTTVVLEDVTRLLRVDELKNNLVATVAHELRTPLTSLHMAIHLCAEQAVGPLTDKQAELLHAAREDCERLQATVDELLDLSRIQAGRMELRPQPLEIEAFVHEAVDAQRNLAGQHAVELRAEVLPGLGAILGDPERMQLVLANLLGNAVRHAPAGSVVVAAASADGTRARFEISDAGPGIPPLYREAVFEKYFRLPGTARGGAGLGLFIAKEIVEAHGGAIGVTGPEGPAAGGSTFWFTVPLAT